MKITRSIKCYYKKHLTDSKRKAVGRLFDVSESAMTQMLPAVELQVLQGRSCFDVLKKGVIAPVGAITTRLRQNLVQNIYATVSGTLSSSKAKGKPYTRPSLPHRRLILACTVAKIVTDTGLKDFDLLVELHCTGLGKIANSVKT